MSNKLSSSSVDGTNDSIPSWRVQLGRRIFAVSNLFETKVEAAKAAGISVDSLDRYIHGSGEVSGAPITRMCGTKGVSLDWLWSGGAGTDDVPIMLRALPAAKPTSGYVEIALYDTEASAGFGAINDTEAHVDSLAFKEDWVRRELRASPSDLRLIYVKGDSMEPDLRAGDIILIDHTDNIAKREGVYVIRMDGALLVKQLQRLPGGVVRVISRNPAYEPFTVLLTTLEHPDGFAVIGRVVWACRRL